MKKYRELLSITPEDKVCLIAHIEPDADALSSMIVMREFLMQHFNVKCVDIFAECETLSETCLDILGNVKINKNAKKYSCAIMMDSPSVERLGIYGVLFNDAKNKIIIDHHATNQMCGNLNIVELVSSTCEIVYKITRYFKYKLNKEQLAKLYAGIITDTNNLSVGNITPLTFNIVSHACKEVDLKKIHAHFLRNTKLKNMQLLALAIENIVTFDAGKIILTHISHSEAKKYKAKFEHFTGIVNKLNEISEGELICFIYPNDNSYYVSMRCKEGYDVGSIAKKFSGGGHTCAAAFVSDKPLMQIEQDILIEYNKQLKNTKRKESKIF